MYTRHIPFEKLFTISGLFALLLLSGCGGNKPPTGVLTYDQAILADSPIAYWKLDETSGSIAVDSSPSGWNGTYEGAVSLGQSDNEGHVYANFSGGYVIASPADYSPMYSSGGLSLEAWFKPVDLNTGPQLLFAKGTDANLHNSGDIQLFGRPATALFLADSSISGLPDPTQTTSGAWHHVVATWDSNAGQSTLWVDGVSVGTFAKSFSFIRNGDAFTIGQQLLSGFNYAFNGLISDVTLYNYVLTSSQIGNHFQLGERSHSSN